MQLLLILILSLVAVCVGLQVFLLFKKPKREEDFAPQVLQAIEKLSDRTERIIREELSKNREEFSSGLRQF